MTATVTCKLCCPCFGQWPAHRRAHRNERIRKITLSTPALAQHIANGIVECNCQTIQTRSRRTAHQ